MCVCVCCTGLTYTHEWMDGSNEGWLCLKGITEVLKEASTHYPPSLLPPSHEVSERPIGATGVHLKSRLRRSSHTQTIQAQTPSGKQKARQGITWGGALSCRSFALISSHRHHHPLICILAFHSSLQRIKLLFSRAASCLFTSE